MSTNDSSRPMGQNNTNNTTSTNNNNRDNSSGDSNNNRHNRNNNNNNNNRANTSWQTRTIAGLSKLYDPEEREFKKKGMSVFIKKVTVHIGTYGKHNENVKAIPELLVDPIQVIQAFISTAIFSLTISAKLQRVSFNLLEPNLCVDLEKRTE